MSDLDSVAPRPGRYDFGLSDAQEARAQALHQESIVFDMLAMHAGSDIFAQFSDELRIDFRARLAKAKSKYAGLTEAIYWPYEASLNSDSDVLWRWYQESGLTCGTYEVGLLIYDERDPLSCDWDARINRYTALPWLRFAKSAADIRDAKRDGAIALYANCQPIVPVLRDLSTFDIAHRKGLRSYMLTYNRMDHVGIGCTERVDAGLSMYGLDVVKHCNEIGIMLDVSHSSHLTTMDACKHSKKPVNANHTAARSLFDHARCKTNEALRAIAGTGGIIGIVAVPPFLTGAKIPTIEHMLDHIDYIANLVGWQHLAIGTDWPWPVPDDVLAATFGPDYDKNVGFRVQDKVDRTKRLVGFQDCRDLPNITRGLVKRGYSDEQIRGILGENALRVFEEVCG